MLDRVNILFIIFIVLFCTLILLVDEFNRKKIITDTNKPDQVYENVLLSDFNNGELETYLTCKKMEISENKSVTLYNPTVYKYEGEFIIISSSKIAICNVKDLGENYDIDKISMSGNVRIRRIKNVNINKSDSYKFDSIDNSVSGSSSER